MHRSDEVRRADSKLPRRESLQRLVAHGVPVQERVQAALRRVHENAEFKVNHIFEPKSILDKKKVKERQYTLTKVKQKLTIKSFVSKLSQHLVSPD